jgi:hypothetical protein
MPPMDRKNKLKKSSSRSSSSKWSKMRRESLNTLLWVILSLNQPRPSLTIAPRLKEIAGAILTEEDKLKKLNSRRYM